MAQTGQQLGSLVLLVWAVVLTVVCGSAARPGQQAVGEKPLPSVFTNCGGKMNATSGYFHTPNFPHPFPTPIACRWLFHAPPGKKMVVYLTQFYLHNSFRVTEYSHYSEDINGRVTWRGRYEVGEISFEEAYLTSSKPYMLIDFRVTDIGNIHLRVDEYLLDVYGFNITYEMVDEEAPAHPDACTVIKCSFLGHCLASAQLDTYKCHCFPSYYGDECQYGPSCDPDRGINMCLNGGKCRYFLGSTVNMCVCLPGFHGPQCESKLDFTSPECEALGCQQRCVPWEGVEDATAVRLMGEPVPQYVCSCNEGYRLTKDNKTCEEQGRLRYWIELKMAPKRTLASSNSSMACSHFESLFSEQVIKVFSSNISGFWNFSIETIRENSSALYVQFAFFGEKSEQETVWIKKQLLLARLDVCGLTADATYMKEDVQPALHSMSLKQYDSEHIKVGHFLSLACKAKGSRNTSFKWYKDGHRVRFNESTRDIWETRIPSSDGETHLSVLSIEKALPIDDGEFSCEVSDWNQMERKSIYLYIVPIPEIDLSPLHVTIKEGEIAVVTCMSRDDEYANFTYSWLRDGYPLTMGPNGEHVEKLAPIGSRLTVKRVSQVTSYTCVVRSLAGSASKTTLVSLLTANGLSCAEEVHQGVKWTRTPANETDVARCPRYTHGTAYRKCVCNASHCDWGQPSFANCSSVELDNLNNELVKITGGYQIPDVHTLLTKMATFMHNEEPNKQYYVGNLIAEVHMLCQMFSYSQTYLFDSPMFAVDFWQVIDVTGLILERAFSTNLTMSEQVQVVSSVLSLTGHIHLHKQPRLSANVERYITSSLVLIARPTCHSQDTEMFNAARSVQEDLLQDNFFACHSQFLIIYQHIHSLFNNQSIFGEYSVNSLVTYVFVETVGTPATVVIPHLQAIHQKSVQMNRTKCTSLGISDDGNLEWRHRECNVVAVHSLYTECQCKWSGHYAVLHSNSHSTLLSVRAVSIVAPEASVLCYLALGAFVVLLIMQLVFKRSTHPVETAVDVNISVAMMLVCFVLISVWGRTDDNVICILSKAGLCCGFLVALTALVAEMLYQLQPSDDAHPTAWVMLITLISWDMSSVLLGAGICAVVCAASILPAQFVQPSLRRFDLCGITADHWAFYILLSIIIIEIMMLCTFIVLVVVGERARRQRVSNCTMIILESEQEQRNLGYLVGKSLVTTFWLLLAFAAVIIATMSPLSSSQMIVALSLFGLALCRIFFAWLPDIQRKVTLTGCTCSVCVCASKKQVKTVSEPVKNDYVKQDYEQNSAAVRVLVRPSTSESVTALDKMTSYKYSEAVSVVPSKMIDRSHIESASAPDKMTHYTDGTSESLIRDSRRFTKEKFEQLSALLGSSLKNVKVGGAEPVFSFSNDICRATDSRPQVYDQTRERRRASYHPTGSSSAYYSARVLRDSNGTLVKPARGVSYIRMPGSSLNDVQKQCYDAPK